jgi:hypothetical protein
MFGQVTAVLSGDTCDESLFAQALFSKNKSAAGRPIAPAVRDEND